MASISKEIKKGLPKTATLFILVGAAGFEPAVPTSNYLISLVIIFLTDRLLTTNNFLIHPYVSAVGYGTSFI